MRDDLVKRLRRVSMDLGVPSTTTLDSKVVAQSADRIEALEAKLAEAVEMLTLCRDMFAEVAHPSDPLSVMLNETLAELTGGKDE